MNFKDLIKQEIYEILKEYITEREIVIENPKNRQMGDYAIPCFNYSKSMRKSPNEIAFLLKEKIDKNNYEKVEVVNGYLNIFIRKNDATKFILNQILSDNKNYGSNNIGKNKTIVIDYSSPNIAKPFGVGHLRSTVIGNSLKRICEKNGYKVISINHLGDWGTQFGKLICAYKKWGSEESVKNNPIDELKKLYVMFHEEAKINPSLEEEGRKYFKALEDGDEEIVEIWEWFKKESLLEFTKTYKLLGINSFDSYHGEAFYNDKMDQVVNELKEKGLLEKSEGALVVRLDDNMPPALIKRKDGATLYITRDLAAAFYRQNNYHFDEALYVVGNEQTLHFKQLKAVLDKMGYEWSKNIHHISFGMILQDGKKMSTRQGKSVKLHDVLESAITLAKEYIDNHSPELKDKEKISKQIGVGAVIFNDLKNYRTYDVDFNLEDILKFEGETGPYVQYTYARINSMLKYKKNININYDNVNINEYMWNIIFRLYNFSDYIKRAKENYDPSEIAKYIIDLAQDFNKLYANEKIVDNNEELSEFRLMLSEAVAVILKEGMYLLGMDAPKTM